MRRDLDEHGDGISDGAVILKSKPAEALKIWQSALPI